MNLYEQEIRFRSGATDFAGTLTLPAPSGAFPAVLLVTGSGPVDRNENCKKLRINAFYEISHCLADNGIASLRYDKRGVGESGGDYWRTGFYDNVQDAHAALHFLQVQESIRRDQVFVLGHSEGALIATRLAAMGAELAGIALLAGAARSGEEILEWQAAQIVKGLKGFAGWLIRTLHIDALKGQQQKIDAIKASTQDWERKALIAKLNAKWMREFIAYNPGEDLPKVTAPVLAITGSKDIQVNPADLELMAQLVAGPFESHEIENMTHILRIEPGEPSISNYKAQIKQPLVPELLDLVAQWLEKRMSAEKSR